MKKEVITINIQNVLEKIKLLTDMDDNSIQKIKPIAEMSVVCINGLSDIDDERLEMLAVAKAIYEFSLLDNIDNIFSFTAGDITINKGNANNSAKEFYISCLNNVRDLVGSSDFAFMVV